MSSDHVGGGGMGPHKGFSGDLTRAVECFPTPVTQKFVLKVERSHIHVHVRWDLSATVASVNGFSEDVKMVRESG